MVLNYHHVIPDDLFEHNVLFGYAHRKSSFETQLKILSSQFGFAHEFGGRGCIISFDDGIINNLTIAAPLLSKHKIRAYFFCVEDHIGSNSPLWIDQFYLWFSYVPDGDYLINGTHYKLSDHQSRMNASQQLWTWFCAEKPSSEQLLQILEEAYSFDSLKDEIKLHELRLRPMSAHELNELKQAGHFIGFHSRSHKVLSHLTGEALDKEVCSTSDQYNTRAMAIPFGTESEINSEVMQSLQAKGYSPILLNEMQSSFDGIPRLNLPDTCDKYEIHAYLSGLHTFLAKFIGR